MHVDGEEYDAHRVSVWEGLVRCTASDEINGREEGDKSERRMQNMSRSCLVLCAVVENEMAAVGVAVGSLPYLHTYLLVEDNT
jgi:hypothetical protein